MDTRNAVVIVLLAVLAACGGKPERSADATRPAPAEPKALPRVAPAIIPPDEIANPTEPPSYEVAIASVAATRNQALDRCKSQPEAVRTQCEQEANAVFAEARTNLESLRGNKE